MKPINGPPFFIIQCLGETLNFIVVFIKYLKNISLHIADKVTLFNYGNQLCLVIINIFSILRIYKWIVKATTIAHLASIFASATGETKQNQTQ